MGSTCALTEHRGYKPKTMRMWVPQGRWYENGATLYGATERVRGVPGSGVDTPCGPFGGVPSGAKKCV
eukprot:5347559-Pyramimonas_sp.AAC.1